MNSTTLTALIVLAFAVLAVFSGYQIGYQSAERDALKTRQLAVANAIEQANRLAAEDAAILRASAAARATARSYTHQRTTEAARHVAKNPELYGQRLDACGLCLARSAAHGTNPATCACQPDDAVPAVIRSGPR